MTHPTRFRLALLFFFTLAGCENSPEEKAETAILQDEPDSVQFLLQSVIPVTGLDTSEFIRRLNEFVPQITSLSHPFHVSVDTITDSTGTCIGKEMLLTNGSVLIAYEFSTGDYFTKLRFTETFYSDQASCDSAFRLIEWDADENDDSLRNFHTPCLTYTNDFVMRSEKKIYWLNSSCYYPYHNFMKIVRIMQNSLNDHVRLDSVKCKCGGARIKN